MCRDARRAVALALMVLAVLPASAFAQRPSSVVDTSTIPPAQAPVASHKCPTIMTISCGLVGGAVDVVGDVAGAVGGAAVDTVGDAALDGISGWVGSGAAWIVKRIGRSVERSTRPELTAPWFDRQYRKMLALALVLAMVFLLVALSTAALRGDVASVARSTFVALPLGVCACFAAVTLVQLLLGVTDEATAAITSQTGKDTEDFFKHLAGVLGGQGVMPGFVAMLGALLAAVLCFVVWIELILREAAIYLAVGFLPLSLAAIVWQRTAHLARHLVEGLIAIILAKLTIGAAVAFAASALNGGGGSEGGMTSVLAGCATLFLAALSPWALMRLIPLSGDQLGMRRGAVKQAVGTAPGASSASMVVRLGMASAFTGGAAAPMVAAGAMSAGASSSTWRPPTPPPDPGGSSGPSAGNAAQKPVGAGKGGRDGA